MFAGKQKCFLVDGHQDKGLADRNPRASASAGWRMAEAADGRRSPRFSVRDYKVEMVLYNEDVKAVVTTGAKGEQKAANFLKARGYKILERNHREKWGELDIIARAPDKTTVFVEVKTMSSSDYFGLRPEDHLTREKLRRVKKLSLFYANSHPKIIDSRKGWRIDLIALTMGSNCCDINHYQNVG